MKGRKPKPSHLHLLNGNPSKKDLSKPEPRPKPVSPKCPSFLDHEAKREWKRITPELEKLGLLTIVDGAALAAYCQSYSHWRKAEEAIALHYKEHGALTMEFTNNDGRTNRVPIPEVRIAREMLALVHKFCTEFGLTPSARARMTLPSAPKEDDDMERLLKPGGG